MNAAQHLGLAALSCLCLLPGAGQQEGAAPAIFVHWEKVLTTHTTPEALFCYSAEDEVDEEERAEADEVREICASALNAAKELCNARLDLLREGMNAPRLPYQDDAAEAAAFLQMGEAILTEGFRRDLEALSFSGTWLTPGTVEPGTQAGRQELLYRPILNGFAFERVDGCNVEISCGYANLNEEWRRQQDAFMARLHAAYGEGDESSGRNPFTGALWEDDAATKRYRAGMQEHIRREQQAWERYREAMMKMVCPSCSFIGSGAGIFMSLYECHLLNSRERFLCLLVAGSGGVNKLSRLLPERSAAFQELHPEHPFGEVFSAEATLFRHPKLEGHPWCLRFDDCGAGFIFVQENEQLRRFAAELPAGGKATVRGCQRIVGDSPRQVFILQGYDPTRS